MGRYSLLRVLVFLGTLLMLSFVPPLRTRPVLLIFAAALVSMVISLVGLRQFRAEAAAQIQAKVEARRQARAAGENTVDDPDASDEDAEVGGDDDFR